MVERRPVLLTVSGSIPPDLNEQIAAGRRPRADYRMMAAALDAELVDVDRALLETGPAGRLLNRLGGTGVLLAWYCFRRRRRYELIVTDGEQVGIPLGLLTRIFGRRRSAHAMIVHILSVPKKARLIRATRTAGQVDRYLVYSQRQVDFIRDQLGVPPDRIVLTTFMVDTEFFAPGDPDRARRSRPLICSAGLERRDYPTMMRAVADLDADVVIAAASPWSKQADSSEGQSLPSNVEIRRLNLFDLRELYRQSTVAVMPLVENDFQAGITTILEVMAVGLPLITTRTSGQTDTVVEGETGWYVPVGDADALRAAIEAVIADRETASDVGRRARAWTIANADIEVYAARIAEACWPLRARRTSS